jgi:hypothetical protein
VAPKLRRRADIVARRVVFRKALIKFPRIEWSAASVLIVRSNDSDLRWRQNHDVLITNSPAFILRGVPAIIFGLATLFLPGVTMLPLVLAFAAYAIADGILDLVGSIRAAKAGERWGSRKSKPDALMV